MIQQSKIQSVLPFVVAAMFLLAGIFIFGGVALYFYMDTDLPPDGAVSGVVECDQLHPSPMGEPLCFGHIQISGIADTARARFRLLDGQALGNSQVRLVSGDKSQELTLPGHTHERWNGCWSDYKKVDDLSQVGRTANPNWKRYRQYSVVVWALRPGAPVIVQTNASGKGVKIWCGTRQMIEARDLDNRMMGLKLFSISGGAVTLIGLFFLAFAFWARRKDAQDRPTENAPIPEQIAWVVTRRSAKWSGEFQELNFTAERMFARRKEGPVRIEAQAPMNFEATWIRRDGTLGELGAQLDKAAGVDMQDGEPLGYPGLEVALDEHAKGIVQDDEIRANVRQLFTNDAGSAIASLAVRKDKIIFTLARPSSANISAATVETWLNAIVALRAGR